MGIVGLLQEVAFQLSQVAQIVSDLPSDTPFLMLLFLDSRNGFDSQESLTETIKWLPRAVRRSSSIS